MEPPILVDRRPNHVAVITLNRPLALNAIDRAMTRAMRGALVDLERDPQVHVLVLAAAGDRGFCVGVDLKERQSLSDEESRQFRGGELTPLYRELDGRTKPAVAAVFGHTLGGGFELALVCDLIVAADDTSFSLPELKWGLIPAAGGCRKLPALIGLARTRELILTSGSMGADEALRRGAVSRVVPKGTQLACALELAGLIAAKGQVAVRAAKRCLDEAAQAPAACEFDQARANECYDSDERRVAMSGFGRADA